MRKKLLAIAMCLVLVAASFAGCSKSDNKDATNAAATSEPTKATSDSDAGKTENTGEKITITVTKWGEVTENDVETKLIDEFNKTNDKNIEVKLDVVPGDGYGDRLTTSFSSGEGYDIFLSGEGDFYKWVDKGLASNLNDLIKADSSFANNMTESIYNMGKINDGQYYLVKDYNPMCLWYNKDMFDAAKVEYPNANWTWDDLYAAAQKLTTKNDDGTFKTFGFQAQSWAYAVSCYLESKGLSYISTDGKTADGYFNSPDMAKALDWYFGMADGETRVSPTTADTDTYGDGTSMMVSGKLAMFISGGWVKSSLESAGTNYGTALIPGNHTSYICAAGYTIGSRCKHPEAAWEVLKMLTGEKASELRTQYEAVLPTSKTQLDKLAATFTDDQKALLQTLDYGVQPIGLRGALGSKINEILSNTFDRVVFKDGKTQDILNEELNGIK
ncbi:ABC transporter substrate-binding protein [Anaerocolumna xylanovorans]|uniref:Multiple sugar transport system substrate-binding protein n=1 Tax=Anaerocolumna xylanovorans DSM 12503 TaxID=1121345 RepID=A0A1M7XXC2_9FIRM|nr:sugar ABC transporter substrate-binding protein [Anaerocolumna xylanovorans]SHO43391.1 multiple sugar transport system substrate-binding protein [Anaerocolumna xylanovorans DSM 12503]